MADVPPARNPLALIIEDNEAVIEIFKTAIGRAGFEVELIGDGQTALERLAVVTPAFVLLDLHLPYISGEQILDYIKSQDRLAQTQLLLATADITKLASLEERVDFVLVKPFGFIQLYELARQIYLATLLLDQKS